MVSKKRADLTGQKLSRWTVISIAEKNRFGQSMWHCVCRCGTEKTVAADSLVREKSKSCGCLRRDVSAEFFVTHGKCTTTEYFAWNSLLRRCLNSNHKGYDNYGGRGIGVCDRWNPEKGGSFQNFFSDMGLKPSPKYSLDRINNNGNYEPENCRWATTKEQYDNRRVRKLDKFSDTELFAEVERRGFKIKERELANAA